MAEGFEIIEAGDGDVVILEIKGHLDNRNATELDGYFQSVMARGAKRIVLDLAGLEYLTSAGLRSVLVALKATNDAGGKLAAANMQPAVLKIVNLSGYGTFLVPHPNRAAAVAAVR
jgi:anti-anti-sigma factor